ncbi:hypothetical protein PR002_g27791 [Phytophthora rubi]|uniref:Secreted protein n=1 Tax=Phytophthora rubi TaxID=129364 RepID=A0A6A3HGJ6_9STRA|nr:hypothetical protein PR002_g27791 [Phytophthora rubi]
MTKQHQIVLCVLVLLDTKAEFLRVIVVEFVVEFRMRMMPDITWIPKIKFVTSTDTTLYREASVKMAAKMASMALFESATSSSRAVSWR